MRHKIAYVKHSDLKYAKNSNSISNSRSLQTMKGKSSLLTINTHTQRNKNTEIFIYFFPHKDSPKSTLTSYYFRMHSFSKYAIS